MSRRSGQPDTPADVQLRECVTNAPLRSFAMVAGAGSGKTTSLIKGLSVILGNYGPTLKLKRQRVACVTYTEIAAGEIWADVGQNPLVHVSTIHSFFWTIVKSFQSDIRGWVGRRIDEKLATLRETAAAFGPRVQARTREKNRRDTARYELEKTRSLTAASFTYGTGSNYAKGVLGHDDVLRMVAQFLTERPLFRTLVAQQYPFLFVDESQDTAESVVIALKQVEQQMRPRFCLGFFGDPMQQIYMTGIGKIALEEGWLLIEKPENFRCPTTVLNVANGIRRSGDNLVQVRGRMAMEQGVLQPVAGTALIFILPADARRDERMAAVRTWMAEANHDPGWRTGDEGAVKVLVIVHRMAAKRLGFADLYAALNDSAPDAFKNGLLDATAWPLRPFMSIVLPLTDAIRHDQEFEAMALLRKNSPRLEQESLRGQNIALSLRELRTASLELAALMDPAARATNRAVLQLLRDAQLVALDPRLLGYLDNRAPAPAAGEEGAGGDENVREIAAMEAFLSCPASQFWGYRDYVNEQSPFSTQQGIKGAEFERVLVVLDDDEGTHTQFSYDRYFGVRPLSAQDEENIQEGKETSVDRTRRLFYVCCTRAFKDLAVVYFSTDVPTAINKVRESAIFLDASIHLVDELPA